MKRLLILLLLAAVVGLPFLLRPKQQAVARADDTVVVITPHNEAIRREIATGFARWHHQRTGRSVLVDWRVLGGTSDIARFLDGAYVAAFQRHWTQALEQPWSAEVQGAFANPRVNDGSSDLARRARHAFLASEVTSGVDVFFGGGSYDHVLQAAAGRIVRTAILERHPEWFHDDVIPRTFAGEEYWDRQHRWVGNVLSSYGILYNRDALARLGVNGVPQQWRDLADPRYAGQLALADPTKSSSMAKAFENILQQEMQRARELRPGDEAAAVRAGWLEGLKLIQLLGANARYFTDSAQKIPIDVAQGDCAVGICIDFYGRAQAEVTSRRTLAGDAAGRLAFVTPRGGTVSSVDPVAMLRGAPHREMAEAFIEYTLTLEGQALWNLRPGSPGGPQQFALRRLPVRKDFYAQTGWKAQRSDPDANPFEEGDRLVYQPAWTAHLFEEMELVVRVMTQDTHPQLVRAWRAIQAAPAERRAAALAQLQDLTAVEYDRITQDVTPAVHARDRLETVRLARRLADFFRHNYEAAERVARE